MFLKEIEVIQKSVKERKPSTIKLLDKLICKEEYTRLNRNRVLDFAGFPFQIGDAKFLAKVKEVSEQFSLTELITVCDVLNISGEGVKSEVSTNIISCLTDFEVLKKSLLTEEISEEEIETNIAMNQSEPESYKTNSVKQDNSSDLCRDVKKSLVLSGNNQQISINFTDVENIISKFNANSHENINVWVQQFETVSNMLNLTEMQKFIFAKRSLGGNALLFIKTEIDIDSWEKLKHALVREFATDTNSAGLHELLSRRKMKDTENAFEYFLHMRAIGNGAIDDSALMHYIIKGITDRHENKIVLYGCKNLIEFREKIKIYETIRNDYLRSHTNMSRFKQKYDNFVEGKRHIRYDEQNTKVCFSCGVKGHLSKNCLNKNKELKCFHCGKVGHKIFECSEKNKSIPRFVNKAKSGKSPVTHAVQELPPNPCKFCAQLGITNAFHWGYSCVNRPFASTTTTTPSTQPEK